MNPKTIRCITPTAPPPQTEAESLWRRHLAIRSKYPDVILLYRQDDFYQALGWDAEFIASEFDLKLTARDFGCERVPVCSLPYDSVERYVTPLMAKGYKVAIIDPLLVQVPESIEIAKYGQRPMDMDSETADAGGSGR